MADPISHARRIAATQFPVTPRMLASACAVGLGLGTIQANAAIFTVKSTADAPVTGSCAAGCTLRDAVDRANATAGTDTIKFDPAVFPLTGSTTITLTENDDLEITDSIIITGPGPGVITINGNFGDRIFEVSSPALPTVITANISGLRLEDGDSGDGGAIFNSNAKLTVSNCILDNNISSDDGGAIASDGYYSTLTVKDSVFTGNTASDKAGAIYVDDTSLGAARGVHISNTRVISGNSAGEGGGIYLDDVDSAVLIENSVIDGNSTTAYGGGIGIDDTDNAGTITIRNTTISSNDAASVGGGMFFDDPDNLVVVDNSTISNNDANGASRGGGGVYLYYSNNVVRFRNTTIADNYAFYRGGGIYLTGGNPYYESVVLQNSIVAGNSANGAGEDLREDDGTFLAEFTIVGEVSGSFESLAGQGTSGDNVIEHVPRLSGLENNGSGRETHAPEFGSLPVDRGSNNLCTASAGATSAATVFDGRGVLRSVDGDLDLVKTCDIGAVEFNGRSFGDCPSSPETTGCGFDTGDGNGFTVGTLTIKDNLTNNTLDSMTLTLTKNSAQIGQEFFGSSNTLDGTAHALCVYFGGTLVAQFSAQAGDPASTGISRWKQTVATTGNTSTFTNSTGNADGLTKYALKSGLLNAASISASAKGAAMPDLTLPATGAVVVESHTTAGRCVSTELSNVTINTNTTLTAKLP